MGANISACSNWSIRFTEASYTKSVLSLADNIWVDYCSLCDFKISSYRDFHAKYKIYGTLAASQEIFWQKLIISSQQNTKRSCGFLFLKIEIKIFLLLCGKNVKFILKLFSNFRYGEVLIHLHLLETSGELW